MGADAPPRDVPSPVALGVTGAVLALWFGVTAGAGPVAGVVSEALTRVELHLMSEGLPWTR